MDDDLKGICGAIVVIIVVLLLVAINTGNKYDSYYSECIAEQVLTPFECKQAAHNMAYAGY